MVEFEALTQLIGPISQVVTEFISTIKTFEVTQRTQVCKSIQELQFATVQFVVILVS